MLPSGIGLIKKAWLEKVPYVSLTPQDGRTVSLLPYFDEKEGRFKQPLPTNDGIIFAKGTPEQGPYYARSPVDDKRDVYIKLVDYTTRFFSFVSTMEILIGIERDILNCSSVVEKYFIFLDRFRAGKNALIANLVMTDIEFLFSNVRSLYDSLQTITRDIFKQLGSGKSKNLPQDYYGMAKLDDNEIRSRYGLSDALIGFYASTRDFFLECRKIRGGFQHQRIDVPVIFSLDEGFALQKHSPFYKDPLTSAFDIWPPEKTKENGLVSVLALISHVNKTVMAHMNSLSEALVSSLSVPSPVVKDFVVFLRGPHTNHLRKSAEYLEKQWV